VRLLLGFVPLLLITGYVLITRPNLEHLSAYGYLGVFGLMMISNATVLLPMPGLASAAAAGVLWNPLVVGLAGGLGGASGELVGYVAGYGVHDYVEGKRVAWFQRVQTFVRRHGFFAIVVLASIPNPFFDVVGLAAGTCSYPAWRFFTAVAIGNTIKCSTVALLGGAVSGWLAH
jgi:uncharacterized membrane protein YdjX (TVP38/TMEM64 family)